MSHRSALKISKNHKFREQGIKISAKDPALRCVVEGDEVDKKADLGIPIGGIGTGGMVWGRYGGFNRWSLKTGYQKKFTEPTCGFAFRVKNNSTGEVTATALQPAAKDKLGAWKWDAIQNDYAALFPKAWRSYEELQDGVDLRCEAFSPVIPGDLETATSPVAIFKWTVTNNSSEARDVSLMMHWANMVGWFTEEPSDRPLRKGAGSTHNAYKNDVSTGVVLAAESFSPFVDQGEGDWAIGLKNQQGLSISTCEMVNGNADGGPLWAAFEGQGDVSSASLNWLGDSGFRTHETCLPMAAVCGSATLEPGETRSFTFALAWDMPTIRFGLGDARRRWHTLKWGETGKNGEAMIKYALSNAEDWSRRIDDWHEETAKKLGDKEFQAGYAINELYGLVDLGPALVVPDDTHYGNFALLECPDYPYYNTLDLWVYAAGSTIGHWPELNRLVVDEYTRSVPHEDLRPRKALNTDDLFALKLKGLLPHDQGQPEEAPFINHNSYSLQNTTQWKDLNSQYILDCWRTSLHSDEPWLEKTYPAVKLALESLEQFDKDGDGLIENTGFPDQTFDNIPMDGPSIYCGGLWLAALAAGVKMAEIIGDDTSKAHWEDLLERGKTALDDKLWNGDCYRVDTKGPMTDALFLEQLFGPFLAKKYGLGDIVPPEKARATLKKLYEVNFLEAGKGLGPRLVVGATEEGIAVAASHGDPDAQITEVITGIAMSFAAQLRCWGLEAEADEVRSSLYDELYMKRGLFFRTPAAFEIERDVYRAPLNMRPLAIWLDS